MSGHSKWHNIQGRKGKQDAKRSNLFSKFAKQITIAAQRGGDPEMNFSLRMAIDKAKAVGTPKDNIDRAIKRGTGEGGEGAALEEATYEAFGSGGAAILIKTVTDNKNRAISDIKHILNEHGGSMGSAGSVQWMFEQWGVITIDKALTTTARLTEDGFELALIDAGAEDLSEAGGEIIIKTKLENFQKVLGKIKELKLEPSSSGIEWIAKDKLAVDQEVRKKLESLFAALEENDDVEDYWTNAE